MKHASEIKCCEQSCCRGGRVINGRVVVVPISMPVLETAASIKVSRFRFSAQLDSLYQQRATCETSDTSVTSTHGILTRWFQIGTLCVQDVNTVSEHLSTNRPSCTIQRELLNVTRPRKTARKQDVLFCVRLYFWSEVASQSCQQEQNWFRIHSKLH